jgi:hypothetical protein
MPVADEDFKFLIKSARDRTQKHNQRSRKLGRLKRDFNIDAAHLHSVWDTQDGLCNLCGVEMDLVGRPHVPGQANMLAASTDRIDAAKGYVKGNVALVHYVCNAFKSQHSIHYAYAIARGIVKTFEERYPQTKVEIEQKLVSKDGVNFYPYPSFHFKATGGILTSGKAKATFVANVPATPRPPSEEPETESNAPR